ncbi:MAG TPA: hypothetical protein PLW61_03635 [Caldisericia bacterium]|nr:hypothetical protein [Caldisericia bacterium]HPB33836.1 hypothetical protein [Caldisericia bacterium]HQL66968.1 hypothetical protein [Caldisericia bacterium]HQN47931.1 hypothetical protein [Caldisericia bacterium]HQO99100.1 hypothetical protein [Caldisericia bacterium]
MKKIIIIISLLIIVLLPLMLINDNVVIGAVQIKYEQSPCPSAPVFNPTNGGTYTIKI